jgi:hypothetical protein
MVDGLKRQMNTFTSPTPASRSRGTPWSAVLLHRFGFGVGRASESSHLPFAPSRLPARLRIAMQARLSGKSLTPRPRVPPSPLLVISSLLLFLPLSPLHADSGSVLFDQTSGPFRITVLTSPAKPAAGPAEISVLVQDSHSRAPILDADVTLAFTPPSSSQPETTAWLPPCCSMKDAANLSAVSATRSGAHNRLLYTATPILPTPGDWTLTAKISHDTQTASATGPLTIGPPRSPASTHWPLLAFPAFAIGVFCLHQRLRNR